MLMCLFQSQCWRHEPFFNTAFRFNAGLALCFVAKGQVRVSWLCWVAINLNAVDSKHLINRKQDLFVSRSNVGPNPLCTGFSDLNPFVPATLMKLHTYRCCSGFVTQQIHLISDSHGRNNTSSQVIIAASETLRLPTGSPFSLVHNQEEASFFFFLLFFFSFFVSFIFFGCHVL